MKLTPEHDALRRTARQFVEKELNPHIDAWEEEGIFPAHEVFKKMGDLGLLGICKPEENGGLGLDYSYNMVVVEELEHALARGAHIYAEIVGYGATSDGADMVAPSGEGAVRCMQMAMHGVDTPIDYLNSHGTSTPVGDVKELGAIREVFGDNSPAISATKAMTGHSLGAAGVQEAIYSLLMLEHGFIAPSINVEELDEQAAGLNIVTKPTDAKLTTVMSNSFGFGGTNATLVMRKYNA